MNNKRSQTASVVCPFPDAYLSLAFLLVAPINALVVDFFVIIDDLLNLFCVLGEITYLCRCISVL
jgi:hypothetical protein